MMMQAAFGREESEMNIQSEHGYSSDACNPRCIACGSARLYCCDGKGGAWSERYRGVQILFDRDDGFHASAGNEHFGYADQIEDIKSEIDEYRAGPDDPRARQAIGWL